MGELRPPGGLGQGYRENPLPPDLGMRGFFSRLTNQISR